MSSTGSVGSLVFGISIVSENEMNDNLRFILTRVVFSLVIHIQQLFVMINPYCPCLHNIGMALCHGVV